MPSDAAPSALDAPDPVLRSMTWRFWVALVLGLPVFALATGDKVLPGEPIKAAIGHEGNLIAQAALCTVIVFVCGGPFFVRAWRSLRVKQPDMFTLIGLGIGAAYVYSLAAMGYQLAGVELLTRQKRVEIGAEVGAAVASQVDVIAPFEPGGVVPFFESAAGIVVLVLLGQVLELRARRRSGEAVRKLLRLTPQTARVVVPDAPDVELPLGKVQPGDLVRVRTGERIPVDGVVTEGNTTVDESMLTGESGRVSKGPGTVVRAGTENGLGVITVKAVRVGDDTLLAQIIALVATAQRTRAPEQRTVDRIARWFVPGVMVLAVVTFGVWWALGPPESAITYAATCTVAVLVIACPTALGLATPLAVVVGMGRAARSGVLFRDAAALERLSAVNTILLDKTGTLTEGKPKLVAVEANIGISATEVLALAAAVERGNDHPLALAIVWEAAKRGLTIAPAEGVEAIPGRGVRGTVGGRRVVVGRIGFLHECGAHSDPMVSEANSHRIRGHGVVFVGRDERCIGLVAMNDPLRATAREAVQQLQAEGMRLLLVTGDHADTAKGVAATLGILEVIADTLPANKFAVVQKHRNDGRVVAMCGDGVNDAPALAAADVGIAMGTGTEVAITAAGVTLVRPDLRALVPARELSRRTVRTIRQNLALAFGYNALAIPIAAGVLMPFGGGLINPTWAAAAMSLGSLSVLVNTLRLRRG